MIETIGIVGGGQLGRMLTEAASPLGFRVNVVDPSPNCPAAQVGATQIEAALGDLAAINELATRSDVLTWEIEHIPSEYLEELTDTGVNIQPSPRTLSIIQDKFTQKELLANNGIPVAPFGLITDPMFHAAEGFVVKSRKGGFDGRGNLVVATLDEPAIEDQFGQEPTYVEKVVPFEKELSIIAARGLDGSVTTYPLIETIQKDNICHIAIAPADVPATVEAEAQEVVRETMKLLSGAGVFAVELFKTADGIVVNEIAPRVHNSGHHTIEANVTSQFEQHIRAITGMPLGSTAMRSAAVMINILGTTEGPLHRRGIDQVLALSDTHPHFYGKSLRPARKVGHITVLASSVDEAKERAITARKELKI